MTNATKIMQAAIDHAIERQAELIAKYKSQGDEWYGLAAGSTETNIGTVKVSFVEAESRIKLQRHATRTIWYLNGKRIARDKLVKQLNAA